MTYSDKTCDISFLFVVMPHLCFQETGDGWQVAGGKEVGIRWCSIYTSGYGRATTREMSFGTRQMFLILEDDNEVEDRRSVPYCVP